MLWIAPHRLSADAVRTHLVAAGHGTALAPGVKTLERVAEALVSLDVDSPTLLPAAATRWLLQQAIGELLTAGRLRVIAEAARRSGLAAAVEQMIAQLKRRGVTAERFAKWATSGRRGERDRELAAIYQKYQEKLDSLAAADHPDVVRLAVASLEAGQSRQQWDLVVVDGWPSFDYYERQLLLAISERARECWVALATEDESGRGELTSSARRTAQWLAAERPAMQHVSREAGEAPPGSALELMRREIFLPPQASTEANVDSRGIQVIAASDPYDEAVQVARWIKRLLDAGTAADEIVVAAASLGPHARRLEEVLAAYGVPAAIAGSEPLGDEPALRALSGLLSLADEDWPFRQLVATLASGLLPELDEPSDTPPWRTIRGAGEWLVRELQIASGRAELEREVTRLANLADPHEPNKHATAAALALPVLSKLSEATQQLPQQASPTAWTMACEQLARQVGLSLVTPAWQEIREAAAWIERIAQADVAWTLGDWVGQLGEWMATLPARAPLAEEGCVRVYAAQAARHCRPAHLFLMGLDEQSFSSAESAGLYSEQQYDELVAADSEGHAARATPPHERTMQLFYDLVRSPRESITFSFAALDKSGQPAPASPLLTEALRPLGPAMLQLLEATPTITPLPPTDALPCSRRDWRLAAVHQAANKKPALLAAWAKSDSVEPASRAVVDSLRAVHHRARGGSFGPLEGVFESDAAAQWFASRFDADHQWSTSQLETYALCPYRFLLGNVLKIAPLGDTSLEIDYGRRGSLLHRVFGEMHRRLDALAEDLLPSQHAAEDFAAALAEAVETARGELASFGIEGVLNDLLAQEVAKWVGRYHAQHEAYDESGSRLDAPLRPKHFELRFGKPSRHADDDESPASVDEPFVYDLGDGMAIRLGGRIDRVDVGQAGEAVVFQVIDYKSAAQYNLTDAELQGGLKLQPPLYALAAAEILSKNGAPAWPLRVGYWVLRQKGFDEKTTRELYRIEAGQVSATDEWQSLEPTLKARVREIVEGVRSGAFPMYSRNEECTSQCDFSHVCRVHQTRSLQKVWPPLEEEGPAADE